MNDRIVRFKANASVKDIVGRGLIYDDNIAIIELVKNSKDAGSPKVILEFTDEINISNASSLVITDFGKGMSLDDIQNKWLNIAYSEKKGLVLDGKKAFAGNKGVGRFSCDRLGKQLTLYTKASGGEYLKLNIDWELFENKGRDDEISSIDLEYQILDEETFLSEVNLDKFKSGTVLVINNLRSEWGSKKLLKLTTELEKFSPSLDDDFEVFIFSNSLHKDKNLIEKINRKINNNILDKLSFKTTYIKSSISSDGKTITTTLLYQGDEVYTYIALNPYSYLKSISVEIHFLDTLSKTYFSKNVGINPNDYGSIFLFYNGFRVSPYGNSKNDWLGLDQRKSQGRTRYLGTREVFGRIDIDDNDDTFSVITSREGLIHNKAFEELTAFDPDEKTVLNSGTLGYGFTTTIIRQLENFVVAGLDWNSLMDRFDPNNSKVISEIDVKKNPSRYQLKEISADKVREACNRILKSDFEIESFKLNEDLIRSLSKVVQDKYNEYVQDFINSVGEKTLIEISQREKVLLRNILEKEQNKTLAAIEEKDYIESKLEIAEKVVESEKRRSDFLETLASPENTLDALITHIMKQISGAIEKEVKTTLSIYYRNPERITKEELILVLENVVTDIAIIKESATMAKKANFDLKVASIQTDLFAFLEDYIKQIASKQRKWKFNIHFSNPNKLELIRSFEPAKLCVFLVNILDNARKFRVNNFYINCSNNRISFIDDGPGFDFALYPKTEFFKKGKSTTDDGTGLGLYHCKKIAEDDLNASVLLENDKGTKGASVILEFN